MMRVIATARVQVIIEVKAQSWGEDCAIGQLYRQAAQEAKDRVQRLINDSKMPASIIGEPKVTGIITEETT